MANISRFWDGLTLQIQPLNERNQMVKGLFSACERFQRSLECDLQPEQLCRLLHHRTMTFILKWAVAFASGLIYCHALMFNGWTLWLWRVAPLFGFRRAWKAASGSHLSVLTAVGLLPGSSSAEGSLKLQRAVTNNCTDKPSVISGLAHLMWYQALTWLNLLQPLI